MGKCRSRESSQVQARGEGGLYQGRWGEAVGSWEQSQDIAIIIWW